MIFKDRKEAPERLAERLASYHGKNPLVLALPRGAVPMAKIIADRLKGELSLVLTRKISIPGYEEYAIGAVSQSGIVYKNPEAEYLAIPDAEFQSCLRKQLKVIEERRKAYRLDFFKLLDSRRHLRCMRSLSGVQATCANDLPTVRAFPY